MHQVMECKHRKELLVPCIITALKVLPPQPHVTMDLLLLQMELRMSLTV
jgi:hypothetical protein